MEYNKFKLGDLIEEYDELNIEGEFSSIDNLQGINSNKFFQECKSNKNDIDLLRYRICRKGMFSYNRATSRNGEKISIAYRIGEDCLVSPSYYCFYVKKQEVLCPEYLDIWFKRPVFDRYARFNSWGSATEFFTFDDFCVTEISLPPIAEQRKIVHDYQVITDRIALLCREHEILVEIAKNLYSKYFKQNEYPLVPLRNICSKIGSGATPRGGKSSYCDKGISLIRSTNVYDYSFSYNELAHINDAQADALSNVVVEPYDVLFNIPGVSIARCCMVPTNVLPARVNQHVMILRPTAGKYMSYFLLLTMCDQANKNLLLGIGQSGSTREAINKQEMEEFKIPLPSDTEIDVFGKQVEICFNHIQNITYEIEILQNALALLQMQLSEKSI